MCLHCRIRGISCSSLSSSRCSTYNFLAAITKATYICTYICMYIRTAYVRERNTTDCTHHILLFINISAPISFAYSQRRAHRFSHSIKRFFFFFCSGQATETKSETETEGKTGADVFAHAASGINAANLMNLVNPTNP